MYSGLQRQVLSLYRRFVRINGRRKLGGRAHSMVRSEFERYRKLSPRDVSTIEHLLRRGRNQLEWYAKADVTGISDWHSASKPSGHHAERGSKSD